ncbi:MAG TPA: hypothetical protein VJS13_13325 [Pyrinomonadaceae bacterium]|nr:hypothetical protein [Pyrinomonadaceae bacterium]
MSDIVITTVTGGSTGTLLKDCIFRERGTPVKYDFYASDGTTILGSDLSSSGCDFPLDVYLWKISSLAFSGGKVTGRWQNRHTIQQEEGTFQAQAGGHGDGEEEAVSSASA